MPNLIVNFFNHFSLYVCGFQIVRDECESVKTQVSKDEQVVFTSVSQVADLRKEPHAEHMTGR